jgi:hypothetical protein
VILSVPYEISAAELEWCFATALAKAAPELKVALPSQARAPRRVILGGVYDPANGDAGAAPPTHKEVEELIKELRKGRMDKDAVTMMLRLFLSDDPAAMEFVGQELKGSDTLGGGRGGGGGGGGGGRGGGGGGAGGAGAGAAGRAGGGGDKHQRILRAIGELSPPAYWPLVADFLGNSEAELRSEAAVALEQLGAPEAQKDLQNQLGKEQLPLVQARLLRAIGSCGAPDAKVHALLLKRVRSEKKPEVRAAAIAALGWLDPDAAVSSELQELLAKSQDPERSCAVAAMAISRAESWKPLLEKALADAQDEALKKLLKTGLDALKTGDLKPIAPILESATKDDIERVRLFGGKPKH